MTENYAQSESYMLPTYNQAMQGNANLPPMYSDDNVISSRRPNRFSGTTRNGHDSIVVVNMLSRDLELRNTLTNALMERYRSQTPKKGCLSGFNMFLVGVTATCVVVGLIFQLVIHVVFRRDIYDKAEFEGSISDSMDHLNRYITVQSAIIAVSAFLSVFTAIVYFISKQVSSSNARNEQAILNENANRVESAYNEVRNFSRSIELRASNLRENN